MQKTKKKTLKEKENQQHAAATLLYDIRIHFNVIFLIIYMYTNNMINENKNKKKKKDDLRNNNNNYRVTFKELANKYMKKKVYLKSTTDCFFNYRETV